MTRTIRNEFTNRVIEAEKRGATEEELKELLGSKRERMGIFEGDEKEGLMEAGQGLGLIKNIPSVKDLFEQLLNEFDQAKESL